MTMNKKKMVDGMPCTWTWMLNTNMEYVSKGVDDMNVKNIHIATGLLVPHNE